MAWFPNFAVKNTKGLIDMCVDDAHTVLLRQEVLCSNFGNKA